MDERESSSSIPEDLSDPGSLSSDWVSLSKTAKNTVWSVTAVATVVGMHFGFPLLVIRYVSGLSPTVEGVLLYLVALLAFVFVPIGGTTLILGLLESKTGEWPNQSLERWPWIFAVPSIIGYIIFSTASIWGVYIPQVYFAIQSDLITQMNLGTGIMVVMGLVLLVTELSLGVAGLTPVKDSRERPKVKSSNRDQRLDRTLTGRSHHQQTLENFGELSYDWQVAPHLGFEDVGGLDRVKSEIYRRLITPLRTENDAYDRFRVSPPTGILLYGPPGTGKSYLARAIAGELGSPFVELSQADLTSMWINESPRKVRRLFEEAETFESSVIFIDEIDGLVATRDSSGHREDSKVLSELLARLGQEGTSYLIIAATNRPDQLDSAILRPGRFDEQFEIGLPRAREREEIFKVQLRNRQPAITESEYQVLGERSEGLTAADIASVVERAALRAAERDALHISFDDLSTCLG